MSCKLSFQDLNNFSCVLDFKRVNIEVVRIVIHCAEVVFALEMKDVRSNYFPGAAWDLVADEWFFRLLSLISCTDFTFGDVIFDLGSHVRPVNGLSGSAKTTFNSRVCSMYSLANL